MRRVHGTSTTALTMWPCVEHHIGQWSPNHFQTHAFCAASAQIGPHSHRPGVSGRSGRPPAAGSSSQPQSVCPLAPECDTRSYPGHLHWSFFSQACSPPSSPPLSALREVVATPRPRDRPSRALHSPPSRILCLALGVVGARLHLYQPSLGLPRQREPRGARHLLLTSKHRLTWPHLRCGGTRVPGRPTPAQFRFPEKTGEWSSKGHSGVFGGAHVVGRSLQLLTLLHLRTPLAAVAVAGHALVLYLGNAVTR